jgi:hypothetical protein
MVAESAASMPSITGDRAKILRVMPGDPLALLIALGLLWPRVVKRLPNGKPKDDETDFILFYQCETGYLEFLTEF